MDPTDREELAMISSITLILNSHRELCGIIKNGGCPLSVDRTIKLGYLASQNAISISKYLNETLEMAQKTALQEVIDRNRPSTSTDKLFC